MFEFAETTLADLAARVAALEAAVGAPTEPPVDPPVDPPVTPPSGSIALSASHAVVGASLTITGSGFGTDGRVYFGEPENEQGWRPVTREASVVSWSDTSIVVTVPAMSPGKAGEPGTYHPVRVVSGGVEQVADFYMDPAQTITGQTFTTDSPYGWMPANGTADVLYDGCTFTATNQTIEGNAFGCITLGEFTNTHQRLTFLNCHVTGNTGPGSGGDYGVNGIKMWTGSNATDRVYDVSFVGCTLGEFSRMSYEQVNAWASFGASDVGIGCAERIALIDCEFEPCGAEPISFGSPGDTYSLVAGCTIKGAGNLTAPQWQYVFECNGTHFVEFRDSNVWHWKSVCFNFNGYADVDPHILVARVDADFTHHYQAHLCPTEQGMLFSHGARGYVRFIDCTFNTGDETLCCFCAGTANPYWGAANFRSASCHGTDWASSTITGCVTVNSWPRVAHVPADALGYWEYGANIEPSIVIPAKV